jgi:hypothetical protein
VNGIVSSSMLFHLEKIEGISTCGLHKNLEMYEICYKKYTVAMGIGVCSFC